VRDAEGEAGGAAARPRGQRPAEADTGNHGWRFAGKKLAATAVPASRSRKTADFQTSG
jgi:hypothetical protein